MRAVKGLGCTVGIYGLEAPETEGTQTPSGSPSPNLRPPNQNRV